MHCSGHTPCQSHLLAIALAIAPRCSRVVYSIAVIQQSDPENFQTTLAFASETNLFPNSPTTAYSREKPMFQPILYPDSALLLG